jgi:hypothetical protein
MARKEPEQYSEEEADRRFKEAIQRAVTTPPMHRSTKQKSKAVKKPQQKP